ncbi:MAG TPA: bifunctional 4-hydroxy-2-oxoglutarate aldolase/2-dehydro-3-deoxy-phosphogluconate aldolase [Candidatus Limnocylindrales bacterium]|nr:bifunctional 4-hydroxy-2-oxoglutarate aldolase/2-dehydro-3-deoxy-phosphogluconate aldolase [Candidatus Limnocylindrales bacterium]
MPDPDAVAALRHAPVADQIRSRRLIAVLRRIEPRERLLGLVATLAQDGVRVFEITFDAPSAGDDLAAVRERLGASGIEKAVVGAGTILTAERLEDAVGRGAAFVVGPTLDVAIIERAVELRVPVIPGAYSPTEIALAWQAGATFVKVFPASSLGPSHVRELRGPLPDIELIATGGVDAVNAGAFLAAGCVAVGVGGALVNGSRDERQAILAAAGR